LSKKTAHINTDKVFAALADKNRRKIVEMLHQKDSTLLELSESFEMSFQGLSKHIKILESAEVLKKTKVGKHRILSLNQKALKDALKWMTHYSDFWNQSFDQLEHLIQQEDDGKSK
jgi:DNA-binding transcriptional ArsR family regulator